MNENTSKEEILNQAFQFHSKGDVKLASKYYQFFIDKGFKDPRVFSNYAAILEGQGKLKEAEENTRKAIELNPNFIMAHSNLGSILKDLGKLKEAELSTRRATEIDPNYANAHANLGSILQDLGKLKEAELSTRKAIEINPNLANAHSNLGSILKDLGKLKEAELSTRKAIEMDPKLKVAYINLGSILQELGKLKEAELSTRKAIEIDPHFTMAHSNLGSILKDLGKLKEAELSTRKAIEIDPHFTMAHSNLGSILKDLGKLKEAELCTRKAIKLDPHFADAYSNLGVICSVLGKLKEAELSYRKAIEIDPFHSQALFALSTLKVSTKNTKWRDKLFCKNLLNKSTKDKVSIYFAKANILHRESNFKESCKCLQLANNLKQTIKPNNVEYLLNKSKKLFIESNKKVVNRKESFNYPESIFIIGMPRSGSTLLESILSMNNTVDDLGELNILEESFLNWKTTEQKLTLADFYLDKINIYSKELRTTTNKWLYNYQYTGIICQQIPNAKIIHCYRNPLDNILSIYRTNFARGNQYSSSLVDCSRVYLDQEKIMTEYKKKFREKIYDLNYDSLVNNPHQEIKSLISWLDWKWSNQYLSPHLNPRSVSTASSIQVRSPINSKSVGGWKNYREMLKPAMEIITQNNKYKDLKY